MILKEEVTHKIRIVPFETSKPGSGVMVETPVELVVEKTGGGYYELTMYLSSHYYSSSSQTDLDLRELDALIEGLFEARKYLAGERK